MQTDGSHLRDTPSRSRGLFVLTQSVVLIFDPASVYLEQVLAGHRSRKDHLAVAFWMLRDTEKVEFINLWYISTGLARR